MQQANGKSPAGGMIFMPGAVALALCAAAACGAPGQVAGPPPASDAPRFLNLDGSASYVGSEACVPCHPDTASSFGRTGMGLAFYPMGPDVAVEDFSRNHELWFEGRRFGFRMVERDGRYFQQQFGRDEQGVERWMDEREMQWVVGSNNHSRSYATEFAGRLFQLPVCWYPETRQWDLCPGFEETMDHFQREITLSCIFCHNGRMVPEPGERSVFRKPWPHGIGCERCHGPGSLHVAKWNAPEVEPTGEVDPTIVNPRALPQPERIQVCFQCHLGDSKVTERVARRGADLLDFRPGRPLTEVMMPFMFRAVPEGEFGISAQADRLIQSRCYRESGGRLECLTCHDPHVSTREPDQPPDRYRQACLSCHQEEACRETPARREKTAPVADDCAACHMRRGEPDDHPHTTFTDHWIRRRPERPAPLPAGVPEFVPVFPEAYEALEPGDRRFHEARAYMLKSLRFPPPMGASLASRAEALFEQAAREGLDDADLWFFLGKTRTFLGRWDEAAEAFRRALAREPDHADAAFSLGVAWLRLGRPDRARETFEGLLARRPRHAGAHAELARVLLMEGRVRPALEHLDLALEEEPWKPELWANRAAALASQGRFVAALEAMDRALAQDPDRVEFREMRRRLASASGASPTP